MSLTFTVRFYLAATRILCSFSPDSPQPDSSSGKRCFALPRFSSIEASRVHRFLRYAASPLLMAALCLGTEAQAGFPPQPHLAAAQSVVPTSNLSYPYRVAVDASGNIYIANTQGNEALKETLSQGTYTESVIASTGLETPYGIAVDASGNVYIADNGNNRVLLETPSGSGYTQTVVTTTTVLSYPTGVAVDSSGNLYIADTGGGKILKETPSGNSYTETVVGRGLDQIVGIAVDSSGNVYASDIDDQAVYAFTYSAGTYTKSTVLNSGLNYPYDVAVDSLGNLYISDFSNDRIVEETYNSPGNYTESVFPTYGLAGALGVAVDPNGNIYIADTFAFNIKKLTLAGGTFSPVSVGSTGGPIYMLFGFPGPATVTATSVETQGAAGLDFTASGSGNCAAASYSAGQFCALGVSFAPLLPGQRLGAAQLLGSSGILANGYIQGTGIAPEINFPPGTQALVAGPAAPFSLTNPFDVAVDASGNVYVADFNNNAVYMETLSAGSYTQSTVASGLSSPEAIAVDGAGSVYIVDSGNNQILKETPSAGSWTQSTVATGLDFPTGVAVDGYGNVYFSSFNDGAVYLDTLAQGVYTQTTVVTGLNQPRKVAVDASGNVYIADTGNSRVVLETLSGSGYTQSTIGSGLLYPYGVAIAPSGDVLIADTVNHRILEETPSGGSYTQSVVQSGMTPYGVQMDGQGTLYVPDANSASVWEIVSTQPPSLSFAPTNVGATSSDSPQTVTAKNAGNASLNFAVPGTGNNPAVTSGYSLSSGNEGNCPLVASGGTAQPLPPGQSCTMPVSFQPVAVGADPGSLTLLDNNLNASSSPGNSQTVPLSGQGQLAVATVALVSNANPVLLDNPILLTATVSAVSGTPTGSVSFYDGTTLLGTVTLSSGTASYTTSSLAAGTHSITAAYSGDSNFMSATSSAIAEVVEDFTIAPSTNGGNSQTVKPGGTASYTLAIGPSGGATFPAAVTFSVSGLPSGATGTFTPNSLSAGSGQTNVTLSIQVAQNTASLFHRDLLALGLSPLMLGMLLLPFSGAVRRAVGGHGRKLTLLLLLVAGTALVGLIGCGSSSSPPKQYTVTVTATSGALSHTITLSLTVQ